MSETINRALRKALEQEGNKICTTVTGRIPSSPRIQGLNGVITSFDEAREMSEYLKSRHREQGYFARYSPHNAPLRWDIPNEKINVNRFEIKLVDDEGEDDMSRSESGRIKKATYWVTGDGREIEIRDMANDHIINTIAYMQRRKEYLDRVEYDVKSINSAIKECDKTIKMFAQEMQYRDDNDIFIER